MDVKNANSGFLDLDHQSDIPKYQQIVNAINNAISNSIISSGDLLPSVNSICKNHGLSRDTVFKAYSLLKDNRVIESVPNKGYYVASSTRKVLLVLDTFKAYKEVLYHSFVNNLPANYIVDVQFHHYNIDNFKTILNNSLGKYYKYVVMNFDHKEVADVITRIPNDKLLLIDWNIHSDTSNNFVCQDFGNSFYNALKEGRALFENYSDIIFLYPEFTSHPIESIYFFKKFCETYHFNYKVITDSRDVEIEKNNAYISVSDRILAVFLEQCKKKQLEPGVDVGFLSYNDTPMKKFIYKGISVVSTDFKEMGTRAATFVMSQARIQEYIETKLIHRESL